MHCDPTKLWLRNFAVVKDIGQIEGKVERQTEKEVCNKMKYNKVLLDVWDRKKLRIYGAWREH